jgi:hypothetical protein
MDGQLYEIQDGVRRAKAAWLCGQGTIRALLGGIGDILQVPLENLRSPKAMIGNSGPRGADWGGIYRVTRRGEVLPPIVIVVGAEGTPIAEVEVQADELDLFRQRYSSDT